MRLPSPAMVVALIALIVAMSGSAFAVNQLPRNSVGAAQLKKSAVTSAKLANNAVTSAKIKNGTIQVADLSAKARAELKGATGATGATGPRGEQGPAGVQSYAFRVGADNIPVESPSGSTAVIDDFVIDAPVAGYFQITLNLTLESGISNDFCDAGGDGAINVLVGSGTVADLDARFWDGNVALYERTAVVPIVAGVTTIRMTMTCDAGQIPVSPATRSFWYAYGALYPGQLTATTSTG